MKKVLFNTLVLFSILSFSCQTLGEDISIEARKQKIYEDNWNNLKEGLIERQVIDKLGKPKLIWRCSTDCYYYYEDIPEISVSPDKTKIVRILPPGYKDMSLAAALGGKGAESPTGCVKFYYGVANPSQTAEERAGQLPNTINQRNGTLVRYNFYGGSYGRRADYYFKEIYAPEKKIYRLEKGRLPDLISMRYKEQELFETWNELKTITNKQKWQDPVSWMKLPCKVNQKMSRGPRVWVKKPTINKQYFSYFTEKRIISLLGEPHIKVNSPDNMIWQYGDVYDSYSSGGSREYRGGGKKRSEPKDFIKANQTGFGRIVFVQDKRGIYVLSKWSEPYWPDVKESLSQSPNQVSSQQQEIKSKILQEKHASEELPKWAIRNTWLNMKKGLTSEQVNDILGKPEYIQSRRHIDDSDANRGHTRIYYNYGLPHGVTEESTKYRNAFVEFEEKQRRLIVQNWGEPQYERLDFLLDYKIKSLKPKRCREKWETIESWKKLRSGLTFNMVERLLGSPHIYPCDPYENIHSPIPIIKWIYGDVESYGILKFRVKASNKGKIFVLSEWSEPYWLEVEKDIFGGLKYEVSNKKNMDDSINIFDKKNEWKKLSKSISLSKVKSLIGEPLSIINSASGLVWLYDYIPLDDQMNIATYKTGQIPVPGAVYFNIEETFGSTRSKKWVTNRWTEPDWSNDKTRRKVLGSKDYELSYIPTQKWHRHELWQKLKPNMKYEDVENILSFDFARKEEEPGFIKIRFGDIDNFGYLRFIQKRLDSTSKKEIILSTWREPYWPYVEKLIEKNPKNKLTIGNYNIKQITNNEYDDTFPCSGGSRIVWQGAPGKYSSIFLFDKDEVKMISTRGNSYFPKVSGNSIVWESHAGLVLCENEKSIRLSTSKPYSYDISEGRVIWEDSSGVNYYDGIQKRHLYVGHYPYNPAISKTVIAWSAGNIYNLFMTKGGQVKEMSIGDLVHGRYRHLKALKVSGENIVLQGYRHFLYCISSNESVKKASQFRIIPESQYICRRNYEVTTDLLKSFEIKDKYGPSINSNSIVWIGDTYDVFLFDGNETMRITNTPNKNLYPKMNERCVVWQGHDGNDYEIYIYDGEQITQITNNEFDDLRPSISGEMIAWQGWDGNDYEIYTTKLESRLENERISKSTKLVNKENSTVSKTNKISINNEKSEKVLAENEKASELLSEAKSIFNRNKYSVPKKAVVLCRKIMLEYPNTKYAGEAKELLKKIPIRHLKRYGINRDELGD